MEQIEKQIINSYETVLFKEAEEICKEVEQLIKDDKKFIIDKAENYCNFCYNFLKDTMD